MIVHLDPSNLYRIFRNGQCGQIVGEVQTFHPLDRNVSGWDYEMNTGSSVLHVSTFSDWEATGLVFDRQIPDYALKLSFEDLQRYANNEILFPIQNEALQFVEWTNHALWNNYVEPETLAPLASVMDGQRINLCGMGLTHRQNSLIILGMASIGLIGGFKDVLRIAIDVLQWLSGSAKHKSRWGDSIVSAIKVLCFLTSASPEELKMLGDFCEPWNQGERDRVRGSLKNG